MIWYPRDSTLCKILHCKWREKSSQGWKKCKQVNAITLWSGIYVQPNVNIWKKRALNVLNQMITEHHYCLSEIILICHTSMSE